MYQESETATSSSRLSDREFKFCEEYLKEDNQTRAYKLAGYKAKSNNVAAVEASRILRKPKVREYLGCRKEEIREKIKLDTDVTRERVLRELTALAYSNIGDFVTWGPEGLRFKSLDKIEPENFAAVQSIVLKKGTKTITRVKMHNKMHALLLLAKCVGFFKK